VGTPGTSLGTAWVSAARDKGGNRRPVPLLTQYRFQSGWLMRRLQASSCRYKWLYPSDMQTWVSFLALANCGMSWLF